MDLVEVPCSNVQVAEEETEEKSSRISDSIPAKKLTKIESKESEDCKTESRRSSANDCRISSNSFDESLNGDFGKRKKLITHSRSRSKKRTEKEANFDGFPKGEEPFDCIKSKNEISLDPEIWNSGKIKELGENEKKNIFDSEKVQSNSIEEESKSIGSGEMSRKDGVEEELSYREENPIEVKALDSLDLKKALQDMQDRSEDDKESRKQEKIITNLCEAIKQTTETFFDYEAETAGFAEEAEAPVPVCRPEAAAQEKIPFVQQCYETTVQEISQVWTNAVNLIKSVKKHALAYAEEKSMSVDRDQLTLEAEMLQLTVDFATNYSKLKTDFLLRGIRTHLKLKELPKTELEGFMDSKVIDSGYDNEDLVAIARTVRELKASVLKEQEEAFDVDPVPQSTCLAVENH